MGTYTWPGVATTNPDGNDNDDQNRRLLCDIGRANLLRSPGSQYLNNMRNNIFDYQNANHAGLQHLLAQALQQRQGGYSTFPPSLETLGGRYYELERRTIEIQQGVDECYSRIKEGIDEDENLKSCITDFLNKF